jgi:hypothetical protein
VGGCIVSRTPGSRCVTRPSPASCVYGRSWFTGVSKGGVRHTTVDGLPRVAHLLRSCFWCCCAGVVSDVHVAFRTQTLGVSKSADVSRHIGPLQPRSVFGTLWFRDGMSRERTDCQPMLHLLVACEVGRYVSFGGRALIIAGGHTASNAPDLFRPPKLSGAGPG